MINGQRLGFNRKRHRSKRHSSKRFGKRFNKNQNPGYRELKRLVECVKFAKTNTPPTPLKPWNTPSKERNYQSMRKIAFGIGGILALLLLIKNLDVEWETVFESYVQQAQGVWNQIYEVECMKLWHKMAEVSGLTLAPVLWSIAISLAFNGNDILQSWYPQDGNDELQLVPRKIRREDELWRSREHRRWSNG